MEQEFWLARWENQETGFHQPEVNPWLKKLWSDLALPPGSAVFVPLCGKSLDLGWLADQGHRVFGVELAEVAVRAFFEEAGAPFRMERMAHHVRFDGERITVYCGNFMDLAAIHIPGVAAVYDRASLIALPPRMRAHYADHLQRIVPEGCRMLLLTLEYDQSRVAGPPHSVPQDEVESLFGARCRIERLCSATETRLPAKFAQGGVEEVRETAYLLVKQR